MSRHRWRVIADGAVSWSSAKRWHGILMITWAALLVPTLLWWRESIAWVVFMSWYANFVGHWSSREGANASEKANDEAEGGENDDRTGSR